MPNKKAYYQGGGGINEPTPGKKKYKSDPALVVQPRFKEPFYRNYDLYTIPGMEDIGPGTGWHALQNYKSVQDFLKDRRERLKPRYVADDSWQLDDGKRTKKNPNIEARAALFNKIIKNASGDHFKILCGNCGATTAQCRCPGYFHNSEPQTIRYVNACSACKKIADHMMPPKEHGTSIYDWKNSPYQGTPKAPKKRDSNNIDFPIDDQVSPILGDSGSSYVDSIPISYQENYTAEPDQDGKGEETLDFGEDLTNEESPAGRPFESADPGAESHHHKKIDLDKMEQKYLTPAETEIYGLPDGVDSEAKDADQTISTENPDYGITDSGRQMYEDKWNI